MKIREIPTGYIFTENGEKGQMETLVIGDYGREYNVKADFLGYTKEINGVPDNIPIKPLSEKLVVTLSTQYGCSSKCAMCDVPKVPFKGNISKKDMGTQLLKALALFPDVTYLERLNIHFARMGEPTHNWDVIDFAQELIQGKLHYQNETGKRVEVIHPVVSTMVPKGGKNVPDFIRQWCELKNWEYNGQAGLQFSINSTDEKTRNYLFGNQQLPLGKVAELAEDLPTPVGRKYCLNFSYVSGTEINGNVLRKLFDPAKFMCKITPIHNNNSCRENGIETRDGYTSYAPYREIEESLKDNGYDVIVFIPSMDEEKGFVTCGNLVLSHDADC